MNRLNQAQNTADFLMVGIQELVTSDLAQIIQTWEYSPRCGDHREGN